MIKVIYTAPLLSRSGYGQAARGNIDALNAFMEKNPDTIDLRIVILNYDNAVTIPDFDKDIIDKYLFESEDEYIKWVGAKDYILITHVTVDGVNLFAENVNLIKHCKYLINVSVWETTKLPKSWINASANVDGFIVPCEWNVDVFKKDTGKSVYYLPHVVPEHTNTTSDNYGDPENEMFKILSVSQWIYRKGYDVLIKAYLAEFSEQKDTILTIKSYRNDNSDSENKILAAEVGTYRKSVFTDNGKNSRASIYFIGDDLSSEEMQSLYNGCSVFALASRGEGFSLPTAEAIMASKPVIIPNLGGHLDYIDYDSSYQIESRFDMCHSQNSIYDSSMEWVEPSITSCRQQLRAAYNDWKSGVLERKGKAAKKYMLSAGYDKETLGQRFYEILYDINSKKSTRS